MFAKTRTINRQYIGKNIKDFMEVPNLIAIQTSSYEDFLQADKIKKHFCDVDISVSPNDELVRRVDSWKAKTVVRWE